MCWKTMWKRVMKGKGFRSEGLVIGLEARGEVQVAEAVRPSQSASGRDWTVVYESGMEPRYWMYKRNLLPFQRWLLLCALDGSDKKHVSQPSLSTSAFLGKKKGAYMLRLRVRVLRNGTERRVLVQ